MAEDSTHPIGSVTWVQEAQALGAPFPKMTTEQYYPEAFNQAGRFNNSADLVNYVCAFEPMDHPSREFASDKNPNLSGQSNTASEKVTERLLLTD